MSAEYILNLQYRKHTMEKNTIKPDQSAQLSVV